MTTTPASLSPALTDEGVLAAALDCLETHISIDMQGVCSLQSLFTVLLRAASRADSIEHTTQRLTSVPTGNGIRYHLDKLDDMATLENQLNGPKVATLQRSATQRLEAILRKGFKNIFWFFSNLPINDGWLFDKNNGRIGVSRLFSHKTCP